MLSIKEAEKVSSYIAAEVSEIVQLRMLGRHFRDIGMRLLMHAAYRSARSRVRSVRHALCTGRDSFSCRT